MPTIQARTLRRAAELVGGEEELARTLRVNTNHLEYWILGVVSPPGDVFLKAADIVSEHDLAKPVPAPDAGKT